MAYICDSCGQNMTMMDDDSFYCYYCGAQSSPIIDESDYDYGYED